jgi:hypothetical protein
MHILSRISVGVAIATIAVMARLPAPDCLFLRSVTAFIGLWRDAVARPPKTFIDWRSAD